ncbi:unnamed protein product [Prunus armeniaca]
MLKRVLVVLEMFLLNIGGDLWKGWLNHFFKDSRYQRPNSHIILHIYKYDTSHYGQKVVVSDVEVGSLDGVKEDANNSEAQFSEIFLIN